MREKLSGRVKGDLAVVAGAEAQIGTAQAQVQVAQAQTEADARPSLRARRWNLEQTTVVAPADGTMVNVMLRPGYFVSGVAFNEVMTFVDTEYQVFAMFGQNELHQVVAGNEAGITLDTYPGHVIKAHVDSIIWAQAQGQIDASGNLPRTTFTSTSGQVPGEARGRRAATIRSSWRRAPAAPPRMSYRTPHTHSPDSQSADQDVVVSRLHHHQAPHQPALRDPNPWLALSVDSPRLARQPRSRVRSRPDWVVTMMVGGAR